MLLVFQIVPRFVYRTMTFQQDHLASIIEATYTVTRIYMNLSTVLFVALSWAVVIQLRNIQKEIRNTSVQNENVDSLLKHCNSHLSTTMQTICQLDTFFSNVLLVSITYIFGQTILNVHEMYCGFFRTCSSQKTNLQDTLLTAGNVLRMYLLLYAICYVCDSIKNEVSHVSNNLHISFNIKCQFTGFATWPMSTAIESFTNGKAFSRNFKDPNKIGSFINSVLLSYMLR